LLGSPPCSAGQLGDNSTTNRLTPVTSQGGDLKLEGMVGSAGTGQCIRGQAVGKSHDPDGLGGLVAAELLLKGADKLLGLSS